MAVGILSALALTGCPSEFGKDGRVAKAVHKDAEEQVLELTRCSEARRREVCAPGKQSSDECRRCGGP
ncbi:hypothetical protein [Hyalangium gracile]|uniref:hypothetical protein n=1 Tax=Hyalangium gracile TaxID=394092 RepID=UPI001CCEE3CF|nr:hypothetical protein [Hyalangium gracile]